VVDEAEVVNYLQEQSQQPPSTSQLFSDDPGLRRLTSPSLRDEVQTVSELDRNRSKVQQQNSTSHLPICTVDSEQLQDLDKNAVSCKRK